jgi:integrase
MTARRPEGNCRRQSQGKGRKYENKLPTPQQFAAFLHNLPDVPWLITGDAARLMVLTAALAGLRVSEVLGLQAGDIDPVAQTLTVRRRWYRDDLDEPKTESSKRTRYVGPLAAMLAQAKSSDNNRAFLFARENGDPPDGRHLQQHVFRPAAEKAGCYHPGFGIHCFRRLHITWRQQVGATPIEAMRGAGHSSLALTWLYTLDDDAREKKQVEKLRKRIQPEPPPVQADSPEPASE